MTYVPLDLTQFCKPNPTQILSKPLQAIQYHYEKDIHLLTSDEREDLTEKEKEAFIDYSGWIYDWSASRGMAYIKMDDEQTVLPDGWWIVRFDDTDDMFILSDAAFKKMFGSV